MCIQKRFLEKIVRFRCLRSDLSALPATSNVLRPQTSHSNQHSLDRKYLQVRRILLAFGPLFEHRSFEILEVMRITFSELLRGHRQNISKFFER